MLKIDVYKRAEKFIRKLPPKQTRQIIAKITALAENPEPPDTIVLKGHAPLRRADIGEYRIVYHADATVLHVVLVGKRNDDEVYKQLKRL